MAGLERAAGYVRNHETALRNMYDNKDIAVLEDIGVIDSDIDEFGLAKRMERVYTQPERSILINTIEGILNPRIDELPIEGVQ